MSGFYRPLYDPNALDPETGEPVEGGAYETHHAPNFVYAPTYTLHVGHDYDNPALPAGWVFADEPPEWAQATGAHDVQFHEGDICLTADGTMWQSTVDNNVWKPGESGWRLYVEDGYAPWQAPTGAHDSYNEGDIVEYNGHVWTSDVNGNVWEPGVYGWTIQE